MSKREKRAGKRKKKQTTTAEERNKFQLRQIHSDLGGYVAEGEHELQAIYVRNDYLNYALQHEVGKCFVIGRTGSGKSALLRMVELEEGDERTLFLHANQFKFKQVELSTAIRRVDELGGHLDYVFKTIWKYLIVTQLIRKRFPDLVERKTVLGRMLQAVTNPRKRKAYDFLCQNEEVDGDKSFHDRLDGLLTKLDSNLEVKLEDLSVAGLAKAKTVTYSRRQTLDFDDDDLDAGISADGSKLQAGRTNSVGRQVQLALEEAWHVPMLNEVLNLLQEDLLSGHKHWILIDDLDKAFADVRGISSKFTRCLFEVILEMSRIRQVRFLVALRTNIFNRLRFYQSEKIQAYCIHLRWSDEELVEMLETRVRWSVQKEAVFGKEGVFARSVRDGQRNVGTADYLLERTLRRPRDLIRFAQLCLAEAVGTPRVTSGHIQAAEELYSSDRLDAVIDEWRDEYPSLGNLLSPFHGLPRSFDFGQLSEVLEMVVLHIHDERSLAEYMDLLKMDDSVDTSDPKLIEGVFRMLWRVGFLEYRKRSVAGWHRWTPGRPSTRMSIERLQQHLYRVAPMFWSHFAVGSLSR